MSNCCDMCSDNWCCYCEDWARNCPPYKPDQERTTDEEGHTEWPRKACNYVCYCAEECETPRCKKLTAKITTIAGLMRMVMDRGYAAMETTPRPPDFPTWSHHPMEGGSRRIITRRSVYLDARQDRTTED